ncbi:glycosyltransferase [Deinococcus roseus]|uniref:O-antigen biosynthesis glycosyl transferase family 4 n=1 Tax=Deinococcus roseus TaxID=392414 RepID=A0ABQ2CX68_9DEIO|nr:glycosyltransferase [Deinococcus roseus]GGJ24945.1 O-antigen biosynthesis glycosyl transferase family 4 [Deinococcus roseus]
MRILFVIAGLGRGGAETQVVRLTENMLGRHQVRIISLLKENAFEERLKRQQIDLVTLPINDRSRIFKNLAALFREVKNFRPDCSIGFMFHGIMVSRLFSVLMGVPSIGSIRTEKAQGTKDKLLKWTDFASRALVVNADRTRNKIIERKLTRPDKVRIINNAMDEAFLQEPLQPGQDSPVFHWVAIGRLIEAKGYDHLIQAMAGLPQAKLTLVGGGPLREALQQQVHNLKLEDRVLLAGETADVLSYLRQADGVVLSSRWEGMPNALLEAMAAGKPCVATNVGGVSSLQGQGDNLIMVQPDAAEPLQEGMQRMMQLSAAERTSMGVRARAFVKDHFGATAVVRLWEEVIENSSNHRRK